MFLCFCAKFQVSYIVIGREEKDGGERCILTSLPGKQWITFHQVKHYGKYFTVKVLVIQNSSQNKKSHNLLGHITTDNIDRMNAYLILRRHDCQTLVMNGNVLTNMSVKETTSERVNISNKNKNYSGFEGRHWVQGCCQNTPLHYHIFMVIFLVQCNLLNTGKVP